MTSQRPTRSPVRPQSRQRACSSFLTASSSSGMVSRRAGIRDRSARKTSSISIWAINGQRQRRRRLGALSREQAGNRGGGGVVEGEAGRERLAGGPGEQVGQPDGQQGAYPLAAQVYLGRDLAGVKAEQGGHAPADQGEGLRERARLLVRLGGGGRG